MPANQGDMAPSFARLLGDYVIALRPILRKIGIVSTSNGMILASQLLYEHQRNNCQPFTVNDSELAERCGLTVDELRGARVDVTSANDRGLPACFHYETRGFPRRGWWRVNDDVLTQACMPLVQRGPRPELASQLGSEDGSQFGPAATMEAPVRARARAGKKSGAATVRASGNNGATGAKPSQGSSSGSGRLHCGPEPELSMYTETKEQRRTEERTPLPPTPTPTDPQPNSPQPAAARDRDQDSEQPAKRKAKAPRIRITTADLPMDLLASVAEDYVTWWNEARKGQCTERALRAELSQLRKIAEDPAGGRAAVEAQVRQAVENYELGKRPWEAITYANWRSFSADYRRASGTSYRKPNPWENEHGRSLLEQARFEGLVP